MIDILRDYLANAASPEFMQMIEDAHRTFDRYGIRDYSDTFVEILMTNDEVDQGQTVQNIYDATLGLQVAVLKLLGITPSDESRIDHLSVILNGLKALEDFEDPQGILDHCMLEMHPEELLAEVLSLVTGSAAEELLVDLHAVIPVDDPAHHRTRGPGIGNGRTG